MTRRKSSTYLANVKKIGNGYYVMVPKDCMDKMDLHEGDDVDVTVSLPEMVG